MKILTAWAATDADSWPWLIAAVDEYTLEEHGGLPEFYTEARDSSSWPVREPEIEISDDTIHDLFRVPTTGAKVK